LLFDNTGTTQSLNTQVYSAINTDQTFDNITIGNLAVVNINPNVVITNNINVNTNSNLVLEPTAQVTYGTLNWLGTITDNGGIMRFSPTNGDLDIPTGATYITNSIKTFNNANIHGIITTLSNFSSEQYKVNLSFTGNVTITPTGSIDESAKGYANGYGPGAGTTSGAAASYGGTGGKSNNSVYGDITNPTNIGSGAYYGGCVWMMGCAPYNGYGGGAIILSIAGNLVNNGSILANATQNGGDAGGSGGSINITTSGTFAGTGIISAIGGSFSDDGGQAYAGGGGGGRIALNYASKTYTGTITARGGTGYEYLAHWWDDELVAYYDGGPGSIFTKASGTNGDLLFDDTGTSDTLDSSKGYAVLNTDMTLDNLTFRNESTVKVSSNITVTGAINIGTNSNLVLESTADITYSTLNWAARILDNGGIMRFSPNNGDLDIPNGGTYISNSIKTFNNAHINGLMTSLANGSTEQYKVNLSFTGDMLISSTGSIDVSGKGYNSASGPGAGTSGAGGTYGGSGAGNTSATYGVESNPVNLGSGGSAGSGGGAIILTLSGTLTDSGTINANGSGNGAGGSINLTTRALTGTGSMTANGGNGSSGGGGGRIAVITSDFSQYTGSCTVTGGTTGGANGTIYPNTIFFGTNTVTNLSDHNATISSNLTNTPLGGISDKGLLWGTDQNALETVDKQSANNTEIMTANLTYLLPGTTYYFKPYAVSNEETSYGETTSFTTTGQALSSGYSVTNLTQHSATISTTIPNISTPTTPDRGILWGLDSQLVQTPIHTYSLNEAASNFIADSYGYLNGIAIGTSIVTGNTGNARSFNGTSDYITIPNSSDINFGYNDFTVSAWVYFTSVTKGYQMIINKSNQSGWRLYLDYDNTLSFESATSYSWDNTVLTGTGVTPTVNTWSHIVVTRTGSTFTMYLNGVNIKTGTFAGSVGGQTVNLIISSTDSSGVQGVVDNIQIYNKGLYSADVTKLYNNGVGLEQFIPSQKISKGAMGNTTGTFVTSDLTNLLAGTTYFFKSYAIVNGNVVYGDTHSFTTLGQPMASQNLTSNITQTSATLESNLSTLPIAEASAKGFLWSTTPVVITTTPNHAYYLNETDATSITDSIGGINGTNSGTTIITGKLGSARNFGGTNYINLSSTPVSGSGSFSFFAWIKTSITGSKKMILATGDSSTTNQAAYFFISTTNQVEMDLTNSIGPKSSATVTDGNWHYVGVVNNNGVFQIYVDGQPSGASVLLTPSLATTNARIGATIGLLLSLEEVLMIYKYITKH
jgi:hypothetical protein